MKIELSGKIGKRMDPQIGDRDFYVFDKPEATDAIALRLSALPNIPLCMILYRSGYQQPLASYCGGAAGQQVRVDPLRLDEGRYFIGVVQDIRAGSSNASLVMENVSDQYRLLVEPRQLSGNGEVEPNDSIDASWSMPLDTDVEGTLAWVGDVDVLCVNLDQPARLTWQISDSKRPSGTVMAVTPIVGERELTPVRLHAEGAQPFGKPRFEADVTSPWTSPVLATDGSSCVRVTLTSDPWESTLDIRPDGSSYRVRASFAAP